MAERAILLAAGRGKRLGALTERRPKPLLEVGGRPLLARILEGIVSAGVREALVITGYLAEQVEQEIGDGSAFGLRVLYRRQERIEGTARALALGRDFARGAPFFFSWSDIIVEPQNYARVIPVVLDADAVIAVEAVDDPWLGAAVYLDERHRVLRLVEKPPKGSSTTRWNNAGFGVLGPAIWPHIDTLQPSPRGEYELPLALAALIEAGGDVRAVPVEGPWFDIGTPEALEAARACFRNA